MMPVSVGVPAVAAADAGGCVVDGGEVLEFLAVGAGELEDWADAAGVLGAVEGGEGSS